MGHRTKRSVFFALLIGVAALLWIFAHNGSGPLKATYSQFLQQVQNGQVNKAVIVAAPPGGGPGPFTLRDGRKVESVLPSDYRDALDAMRQKMVDIEIRDASSQLARVLASSTPFLILLGFWAFAMYRLRQRDAK